MIWWLLRLTPPKPQTELFPPLRILAQVLRREETPHRSPWWLTLLRLLMAALVILALSEPVFNPRERLPSGGTALALVVDNSWASASDWELRVATAQRLIADAEAESVPVVLEASGVIVYRVDTLEEVVPTVEAALLLAFQSRRSVAVLLSQKLIGAKNFSRGDK